MRLYSAARALLDKFADFVAVAGQTSTRRKGRGISALPFFHSTCEAVMSIHMASQYVTLRRGLKSQANISGASYRAAGCPLPSRAYPKS